MKKGNCFLCSIYIVVFALAFLLSACGSDETSPSIDTSQIPGTVFFNDTGSDEFFLFRGRATDNTNVDEVLVSGDNGATWHTADIDSDPPNHLWDVEWTYLASATDLSAGMHTVLVRAVDRDGNESTSVPVILESLSGSTTGELVAVFTGAAAGEVIGLSTGVGDAYGDSAADLTVPITVDLTVQGSGYGDMLTSGGLSPVGNSVGTVLRSGSSTASLFSVDADLTIRNVRLLGGTNGIRILDDGGADPYLSIENCLFDRQSEWAVHVRDDDGFVAVEVISSIVDASAADSSGGAGGIFLDTASYQISGSGFYLQSEEDGGAGVFARSSAGIIDSSVFEGNAVAVWASSGIAVITSSNISGAAYTTNGINLSGDPGGALIRRNTINGNSGYGLRVGGEMELTLRKNAITNNGLSGVLIDSDLSNTSLVNINLGSTNDRGNNLIDDNTHPDIIGFETQAYVTQNTNEGPVTIPANYNYWGVSTNAELNNVIVDHLDLGGSRAQLAVLPFWANISGEVGP